MNKVVLITGVNSGIGFATAKYFSEKNWYVAGTVRHTKAVKISDLSKLSNTNIYKLDITDNKLITHIISEVKSDYGHIDVLVNNIGYGLIGPFELATTLQIERQINTNLLGLINMTKAVTPIMRAQKSGVIVNLSSISGRIGFPYYSYYCATKYAIEGLSESLSHELCPYGIRVKIIEPGPIDTNFFKSSADYIKPQVNSDYYKYVQNHLAMMQVNNRLFLSPPQVVAKKIWQAVNDRSLRIRYPAGMIASFLILARSVIPDTIFQTLMNYKYRHSYFTKERRSNEN